MHIQINTDDNIEGDVTLIAQVDAEIRNGLSHFADQITRVEVHLSDENAGKGGSGDKRCMIEARPTGRQPMAVTSQGPTVQEASAGALQKLQSKLQSSLSRTTTTKGGHSIRDLDPL